MSLLLNSLQSADKKPRRLSKPRCGRMVMVRDTSVTLLNSLLAAYLSRNDMRHVFWESRSAPQKSF